MSILSDESKFALLSMGNTVAQEIAKSRSSKDLETIRSTRQAHDMSWCKSKHIKDPVGPNTQDSMYVVAIYVKYVMNGVNYLNNSSLRSATCKGYALAVHKLFGLRNFPSPVSFSDESNWIRTPVHNMEREEDIASQRKPANDEIHAGLIKQAKKEEFTSLEAVVVDAASGGKASGWRSSEYSQTKPNEVDYHEYPSGKK